MVRVTSLHSCDASLRKPRIDCASHERGDLLAGAVRRTVGGASSHPCCGDCQSDIGRALVFLYSQPYAHEDPTAVQPYTTGVYMKEDVGEARQAGTDS